MTLGARVLKTGIAISLALYLCSMLGLAPGTFAAVAAVFTVQPTVYQSWRQVLDQVQTEANALEASGSFMNRVMTLYNEAPEDKLGLILVGSALFEYGFQLGRLEKTLEHYLGKRE